MDSNEIFAAIMEFLNKPLFSVGQTEFSATVIITIIFSIVVIFYLAAKLEKLIVKLILLRSPDNIGTGKAMGTISRYLLIVVGLLVVFQSLGINFSTLNILFGALGVGIGFGLQNVANNFISGLIILFERPIKVGDRIEVGGIDGDIVDISARATTINTNDNITYIVPNSEFVSSTVINWSHADRNVRFKIPVGVSYKEDPEHVRKVLLEVASRHEGVLSNPEPTVLFDEYADSSLNFFLVVWTSKYINRPRNLRSELYYDIFKEFKQHGIEIPFPQRDLHLKSGMEKINYPKTK